MSKWKIYHNPQCSKSREALAFLNEKGIEPEVIEYLKTAPTEGDIKHILSILSDEPSKLVRVKDESFKDLSVDLSSREEIARCLALHPKLIERPIVIKDNVAVIARPLEALERLL